MLRKLLAGATLKIAYDPKEKLLRCVSLENVAPTGGSVSIRFTGRDPDPRLLDRRRFENDPKVRVITEDQFLQMMLVPLLVPTPAEAPLKSRDQ